MSAKTEDFEDLCSQLNSNQKIIIYSDDQFPDLLLIIAPYYGLIQVQNNGTDLEFARYKDDSTVMENYRNKKKWTQYPNLREYYPYAIKAPFKIQKVLPAFYNVFKNVLSVFITITKTCL